MKQVGIIMGSKSDLPIMQKAIDILNEFGIKSQLKLNVNSICFRSVCQSLFS